MFNYENLSHQMIYLDRSICHGYSEIRYPYAEKQEIIYNHISSILYIAPGGKNHCIGGKKQWDYFYSWSLE